ncbi:DUF4867 family protein [Faecalicatena sp. AGMB00832]|uniref:DUF4867 family protein n=1 Tax=Faecalicatena faecalis TaxID=2726362 RepID=A0ABS6DB92_9FIRM|nr:MULTISPECIES: DUF4867 family protein [Faecalicatena]MBU3878457.1 DUF4867 family protein [Faecalicatena faecalis]MCI6465586.1 DUF4867 family protein [Faecalicatena sp.]MDY5617418.1 DUF4867 family protein [Lachnospiraceae bacterium]
MEIQKVTDASFGKYGKVLEGYSISRILKEMEHTPLPAEVIYVPSVEEMEALPEAEAFKSRAYGGLPIQIGYCNGDNHKLNALEYHRSSEINIAVTDLILLIGAQQDIQADYTYDTSKVEAFLVPAGTVIEVYATTLHYAPCTAVKGGFRCVVILPRETNTELTFEAGAEGEDRLITAKNKWLLAHEEAGIEGAFCGLKGENITLESVQ